MSATPHVFSTSMLGMKGSAKRYPIVGGQVKAAHTKIILYWLAHEAHTIDSECPPWMHDKVRTTCISAFVDCLVQFDTHGAWLPPAVSGRAHKSGTLCLMAYISLGQKAMNESRLCFGIFEICFCLQLNFCVFKL